jgi:ComEC/Rec2-related protein
VFPLDFFTLGFVGGLLADWMPPLAGIRGGLLAAGSAAGAAAFCWWVSRHWRARGRSARKPVLRLILAGGGAASAVFIISFHQWAVPSHHLLRNLPREKVNITGHIIRPTERRSGSSRPRIYVKVERLSVRGVEIPVRGTVRFTLSKPPADTYGVGDRVLVRRVRLVPPIRYRNPGAFDYREFLRLRNIHATAYLSPRAIERIARAETSAFNRWIYGFRDRLRSYLKDTFSPERAALLEALTLGVREDLDREVRESFRLAGASHILAISGLHVGFITAFFHFAFLGLFRLLPPGAFPSRPVVITPMKAASAAVIPVIILFALLTGARVSTVRAAIMAVVYLTTRIFERPGGAMHSVLLAALIILIAEPGFVWDTGFQLSFIAVAAIILAVRRLPRPAPGLGAGDWGWWRCRLLQFSGIQFVVTVAMAPLTAFHFQEIHLAGLATNFLLIPIASITVPLTFITSVFAAGADYIGFEWSGVLTAPVGYFLSFLAWCMIALTRLAASVSGGTLLVPRPGGFLIAAFLASLTVALGMRRAALRRTGWAAVALTVFLVISPFPAGPARATGRTTLLFPDAGRKNIFFIRLPDGRGFAVDASRRSRARFDIWGRVLAPLLRNQGERDWSGLFLLARTAEPDSAQRELQAGMNLRRVIEVGRSGRIRAFSPASGSLPGGHAPRGGNAPDGNHAPRSASGKENSTLWTTRTRKARLSLMKWDEGHLAFKLEHGRARWLMLMNAGRRIRTGRLPKGKFDLVRLPERMLRNKGVLSWLERIRPFAVIASPQSSRRLPVEKWRILRARQRALGVYRSRYAGMVRVSTGGASLGTAGASLGATGRIERYSASRPWPRPTRSRWVRYYSGEERLKKRLRARRRRGGK